MRRSAKSIKSRQKQYGKKGATFKLTTEQRARSLASKRRTAGKPAPKLDAPDNEVIAWYKTQKAQNEKAKQAFKQKKAKKPVIEGKGSNIPYKGSNVSGTPRKPEQGKTVYLHEGNRSLFESIKAPKTYKEALDPRWQRFEDLRLAKMKKMAAQRDKTIFKDDRAKWQRKINTVAVEHNPFQRVKVENPYIKTSVKGAFYDEGTLRGGKGSANLGDYLSAKNNGYFESGSSVDAIERAYQGGTIDLSKVINKK